MNKQPNSDQCFVCGVSNPAGLRLVFEDDGESVVQSRFEIPSALQGYPGIAHGGVVAVALDEAMGRVAMINAPNRFTMTVRMDLKYRQPVPVEAPVSVIGKAVKLRGSVVEARGELRLADGTLAVEAEGTLVEMPGEMLTEDRFASLAGRSCRSPQPTCVRYRPLSSSWNTRKSVSTGCSPNCRNIVVAWPR